MDIFTTIIFQPLYNLLVWLYDVLPGADLGFAIIAITILVKGILFPLTFRSLKSQKELQEVQPKIKEIRETYKDDKEKMAQELMAIYKEHNVNPFASCLPLLIQLPIFLGLFRVLQSGFGEVNTDLLYSFVHNPGTINETLLGLVNLSEVSIVLAVLTAVAQYFQMKLTVRQPVDKRVANSSAAMDENVAAAMNRTMMYFLPAFTLILGSTSLPGGVTLYWLVTTVLTVIMYKIFLGDKKEKQQK